MRVVACRLLLGMTLALPLFACGGGSSPVGPTTPSAPTVLGLWAAKELRPACAGDCRPPQDYSYEFRTGGTFCSLGLALPRACW